MPARTCLGCAWMRPPPALRAGWRRIWRRAGPARRCLRRGRRQGRYFRARRRAWRQRAVPTRPRPGWRLPAGRSEAAASVSSLALPWNSSAGIAWEPGCAQRSRSALRAVNTIAPAIRPSGGQDNSAPLIRVLEQLEGQGRDQGARGKGQDDRQDALGQLEADTDEPAQHQGAGSHNTEEQRRRHTVSIGAALPVQQGRNTGRLEADSPRSEPPHRVRNAGQVSGHPRTLGPLHAGAAAAVAHDHHHRADDPYQGNNGKEKRTTTIGPDISGTPLVTNFTAI